jgi:hypothetical protein
MKKAMRNIPTLGALMLVGGFALLSYGQASAQAGNLNPADNSAAQNAVQAGSVHDPTSHANCQPGVHIPEPAASAGFDRLTFCDDFDSLSTIDVSGTGAPGFKWYTKLPFSPGRTLPSAYSISDSVLTVTSTGYTANWGLTTRDPVTGNGHAFNFGYFEARIKFDPSLSPNSKGWPSFWSLDAYHTEYNNDTTWAELDFFEAYTGGYASYSGEYLGTLHQEFPHRPGYENVPGDWYVPKPAVDWNSWNIIGCLWQQGQVTWYLNGKSVIHQSYSADGLPKPPPAPFHNLPTPDFTGAYKVLDGDLMQLIVGSSPGWPLQVDYVRVWQE